MIVNGKQVQSISYDGKDINIYKNLQAGLKGNIYKITPTAYNDLTTIKRFGLAYTQLKSVELPSTVTSVQGYAFAWCPGLLEAIIPETFEQDSENNKGFIDMNSIYAGHFYKSVKLAALYLQRDQLYVCKDRFLSPVSDDPSLHIFVHPNQYNAYINDTSWTPYASMIYILPTYSYDLTQLQWEQGYYDIGTGTAILHHSYTRTPHISLDNLNISTENAYCVYGSVIHPISASPSRLYVFYWNENNTYLGYQISGTERPMIELNIPSAAKYIAFCFFRPTHTPEDIVVAKLVSLERPS